MKQTYISLILVFSTILSFGQKIGFTAGPAFNNADRSAITNNSTYEVETLNKTGLRAGAVFEYEHSSGFTAGTNLIYSLEGYKTENTHYTTTVNMHYLDIPLYLGYTYTITESAKVFYEYYPVKAFLCIGPELGLGLHATQKTGELDSEEIEFGSDDDQYKRLNTQLIFSGGIDVGGMRLNIGYEYGFTDLTNADVSEIKTKSFFVNLAYVYDFGK